MFLRWSPTAPRISDFDLLLCLNRTLQEPERGLLTYSVQAKVGFVNGATDNVEFQSGPFRNFGRDRCASIPEQHSQVSRGWRDFSVRTDLRYRPDKIKSVSVTVRQEQEEATQTETFTPSFHIYPTRQATDGNVKPTREFIAGRIKGEALRSARRCKNIVTVEKVSRPAEDDRSEYAQGFELGRVLAGNFLNSDQRCDALPVVFEIGQVGISAAIRSISKCDRPPGGVPPRLALAADHVCLRPFE